LYLIFRIGIFLSLAPPEHWDRVRIPLEASIYIRVLFCVMPSCVSRDLAMGTFPVQGALTKCIKGSDP